jgi:hypothetical protein
VGFCVAAALGVLLRAVNGVGVAVEDAKRFIGLGEYFGETEASSSSESESMNGFSSISRRANAPVLFRGGEHVGVVA